MAERTLFLDSLAEILKEIKEESPVDFVGTGSQKSGELEEQQYYERFERVEKLIADFRASQANPNLVYMDKVDFEHELGMAKGGVVAFASIEDLKHTKSCVKQCGIVEVEVLLRRVVEEPNHD